jgi:hypothetical protein
MCSVIENIFPLLISTQSVAFSHTDFYTTLYFVNQRNYKTLAMQEHALTRTRYFYSLNVIISHPIVYKEGLGYLSVCAIASLSSPPSHVCIRNGHPGSELCCVHCNENIPSVFQSWTDIYTAHLCCWVWFLGIPLFVSTVDVTWPSAWMTVTNTHVLGRGRQRSDSTYGEITQSAPVPS